MAAFQKILNLSCVHRRDRQMFRDPVHRRVPADSFVIEPVSTIRKVSPFSSRKAHYHVSSTDAEEFLKQGDSTVGRNVFQGVLAERKVEGFISERQGFPHRDNRDQILGPFRRESNVAPYELLRAKLPQALWAAAHLQNGSDGMPLQEFEDREVSWTTIQHLRHTLIGGRTFLSAGRTAAGSVGLDLRYGFGRCGGVGGLDPPYTLIGGWTFLSAGRTEVCSAVSTHPTRLRRSTLNKGAYYSSVAPLAALVTSL